MGAQASASCDRKLLERLLRHTSCGHSFGQLPAPSAVNTHV